MVSVIKEICIFVIIAQAVLFFVPGSSYVKYVRVLVGIIIITRIMEPIYSLFPGRAQGQEIRDAAAMLEASIRSESGRVVTEEREAAIYKNIEEELLQRLNACKSSYRAVAVEIGEDVVITVSSKENKEEGKVEIEPVRLGEEAEENRGENPEGKEELAKIYGSCLGVDENKIKIIKK